MLTISRSALGRTAAFLAAFLVPTALACTVAALPGNPGAPGPLRGDVPLSGSQLAPSSPTQLPTEPAAALLSKGRGAGAAKAVSPRLQFIPLAGIDSTERQRLAFDRSADGSRALAILTPRLETARFQAFGVTWDDPTPRDDLSVSFRIRRSGAWSAWRAVQVESHDVPDAASTDSNRGQVRGGTTLVFVGEARGVQVRVDRRHGANPRTPLPAGLRVDLVDPGSSTADRAPALPAHPVAGRLRYEQPKVYTRSVWGADETLRNSRPEYTDTIKVGFVHHTDTSSGYEADQVPAILRSVYAYHVRSRGWSDVGYNFFVDRFGRIWEGRAGGVERAVLGGHTGGFNRQSFGVAVIGTYSKAAPGDNVLWAVKQLMAWKLGSYSRNPTARYSMVSGGGTARWPAGRTVEFTAVSGHRDAAHTDCPGDRLYAMLPSIREGARTLIAQGQPGAVSEVGRR